MKILELQFNLPTAEYPDPKKEEVQFDDDNNEPIVMDGNFIENFNGTLDGIVNPNAKNLSFEFVDLLLPSDKDQGMRLIVDFEQTRIIFERMEDKNWVFVNKTEGFKYHFAPGVAFHLFFIINKKGVIVNMNYYGPVPLPAVGEIDFKNLHRIKYHLDNSWLISNDNGTIFGISADNSSGIVLRGKVDDENAKYFSIKLWTKEADGFFETIFEVKVNILGPSIQYSNGSKGVFEDAFEKGKQPKYDDAGSPFDVLVQFNNETFDIWMNNTKIRQQYNTTVGYGVVNYVQILGDASGDLIQLQKTPMECKFKMADDRLDAEHTLNITGKVLKESGQFTIELKYSFESSPLVFDVKFDKYNSTVWLHKKIRGRGIPKIIEGLENLVKIGEDFHLKFQYRTNAAEILVAVNGKEYIFTSKGDFDSTKQYSIFGDIVVLDEQSTPCVQVPPFQKKPE